MARITTSSQTSRRDASRPGRTRQRRRIAAIILLTLTAAAGAALTAAGVFQLQEQASTMTLRTALETPAPFDVAPGEVTAAPAPPVDRLGPDTLTAPAVGLRTRRRAPLRAALRRALRGLLRGVDETGEHRPVVPLHDMDRMDDDPTVDACVCGRPGTWREHQDAEKEAGRRNGVPAVIARTAEVSRLRYAVGELAFMIGVLAIHGIVLAAMTVIASVPDVNPLLFISILLFAAQGYVGVRLAVRSRNATSMGKDLP